MALIEKSDEWELKLADRFALLIAWQLGKPPPARR
jgi:hypothetical protein